MTNNTAHPLRRGGVEIFLGYESDLAKAVTAARQATQATEGVLAAPEVSVHIRELGRDDVVMEARFWSDSRRSDFVATASAVRHAVVAALRDAGVRLPDPEVRTLVPGDVQRWREALDAHQRR